MNPHRSDPEDAQVRAHLARWLGSLDDPAVTPTQAADRAVDQAPASLRESLRREINSIRALADGTSMRRREEEGAQVFGFTLECFLGKGATGRVWRARGPDGKQVALKIIHPLYVSSPEGMARVQVEAQAASSVRHPGLVRLLAQVSDGTAVGLVTELVGDGRTLADEITSLREGGEGVEAQAFLVRFLRVLRGMEAMHGAGVLHLDIKPGNVLLAPDHQMMMTDFGLARVQDNSQWTRTFQLLGTPAYMSPEVARGDRKRAGAASDVFSLGATLYEALSLQRPFRGSGAAEIMHSILHDEPAPLTRALRGLGARQARGVASIVARALEKSPHRRYRNAGSLADDVERVLASKPVEGLSLTRRTILAARRNRGTLSVLTAMVLLTASGLWVARRQGTLRDQVSEALSLSSDLVNLLGERPLTAGEASATDTLARFEQLVAGEGLADPLLRVKVLGSVAGLLCDRGMEDEALGVVRQAFNILADSDFSQRASLHLIEALCHERRGDEDAAADAALRAVSSFGTSRSIEEQDLRVLAQAWAWKSLWMLGRDEERDALGLDPEDHVQSLIRAADRARAQDKHSWGAWIDLRRVAFEARGVQPREDMLTSTRSAREVFERRLGTDHRWTLEALFQEALILFRLDRYSDSSACYAELAKRSLRALGPGHPMVGFALSGQAENRMKDGLHEEAVELYKQGVTILEGSLAANNRKVLRITIGLGVSMSSARYLDQAVTHFRKYIRKSEDQLGAGDYVTVYLRRGLVQSLRALGEAEEIREVLDATWDAWPADIADILIPMYVQEMQHAVGTEGLLDPTPSRVERLQANLSKLLASLEGRVEPDVTEELDGLAWDANVLRACAAGDVNRVEVLLKSPPAARGHEDLPEGAYRHLRRATALRHGGDTIRALQALDQIDESALDVDWFEAAYLMERGRVLLASGDRPGAYEVSAAMQAAGLTTEPNLLVRELE